MTNPQVGLSLRERNKLRLRSDLLDAVLDLYNESGFAACTVENIARHVGCAKATAYVYFPGGRDEMLCAIYERLSDEVSDNAERLRALASTVHGRIMGMAEALLELSCDPRSGQFFAQLNPALSPVLTPVLGRSSQHYAGLLTEDLSAAANSDVSSKAIGALATLLVGAFREASIKVAAKPKTRAEILEGIAVLADGLLHSIQSADNNRIAG